jgi:hypothetical protein
MAIVHESFKSLIHFLDTVEKRTVNNVFKSQKELSSEHGSKRFTKTENYLESVELIKKGYSEPLNQLKKGINKKVASAIQPRTRAKMDIVGFTPIVPAVLIGRPDSMFNRVKTPQKQKMINLVYNFGGTANITADELIKGGINFLSLVNILEKQGFRIKIDLLLVTALQQGRKITSTSCLITVKEFSQRLNLLKLCYPLVHPSMLRRNGFKWIETQPKLVDKDYLRGYGTSLYYATGNSEKEERFLRDNNVLKADQRYLNVYQTMENNDVSDLLKLIGLN